jgi:hypothetical protein
MSYRLRIRLAPDFDLKPVRKAIADLIESLGDTRTPRRAVEKSKGFGNYERIIM